MRLNPDPICFSNTPNDRDAGLAMNKSTCLLNRLANMLTSLLATDVAGDDGPEHRWACHSGVSMHPLTADPFGQATMLLDSGDEAVAESDEKRWFARQARQKKAQKLYRHACCALWDPDHTQDAAQYVRCRESA